MPSFYKKLTMQWAAVMLGWHQGNVRCFFLARIIYNNVYGVSVLDIRQVL